MKSMLKKILNAAKAILEPVGAIISNVVNFVLLLIVYSLSIGIVSIIMKLFGKHFLELKKQNKISNWHDHKVSKQPLENYYRTF